MRKLFEIGGVVTAVVLVAFGVVAIVMGFNGRQTVSSSLKQEQIVGTPDMTPAGIKAEAQQAGLKNISFPSCSVANDPVTTRRDGPLLRPVHADPRARGDRRLRLLADGPVRGAADHAESSAVARRRHRATRSSRSSTPRPSSRSQTAPATSGSPRPR